MSEATSTMVETFAFQDAKSQNDYTASLARGMRSSGNVEVGPASAAPSQWNPPCGRTCNCVAIGTALPQGATNIEVHYFNRGRDGNWRENAPNVDLEWALMQTAQITNLPDGRVYVSSVFKNWSDREVRAGRIDVFFNT